MANKIINLPFFETSFYYFNFKNKMLSLLPKWSMTLESVKKIVQQQTTNLTSYWMDFTEQKETLLA